MEYLQERVQWAAMLPQRPGLPTQFVSVTELD
jgi:hypothetical protein